MKDTKKRTFSGVISEDTDKQIEYLKDFIPSRKPKTQKRSETIAYCVEKVYNEYINK